jgi:rRNA maturation RNase YbeY
MILFHKENIKLTVTKIRLFTSLLKELLNNYNFTNKEINIIFCNDEYIKEINTNFLDHNYETDIITFDLTENAEEGICAEIYISTETVKFNSDKFSKTFDNELKRVMIHGFLHLVGFNDLLIEEKELMREKEDYYLVIWEEMQNVPRGTSLSKKVN